MIDGRSGSLRNPSGEGKRNVTWMTSSISLYLRDALAPIAYWVEALFNCLTPFPHVNKYEMTLLRFLRRSSETVFVG